jgi:hypothetical protein
MKDSLGKEIKVGNFVKFICDIERLHDVGIGEDSEAIIKSIGRVIKANDSEEYVEIKITELGKMIANYYFFPDMIQVV